MVGYILIVVVIVLIVDFGVFPKIKNPCFEEMGKSIPKFFKKKIKKILN